MPRIEQLGLSRHAGLRVIAFVVCAREGCDLMCGICGIVLRDPSARVSRDRIAGMLSVIEHRGPDDSGIYHGGRAALGHRRLSIIDLNGGHQPLSNERGDVWIAFNGEVYNHGSYRQALTGRGHSYRTRTDTETIVHLYEESGRDVGTYLRGMFAFAIWDDTQSSLLLLRDRSGIKPLFYALTPDGDIVFGSEIKAVLASGLVPTAIDDAAVAEYFALGSVNGDRTLFKHVRKLQPGCGIEWRQARVAHFRYWRLPAFRDGAPASPQTADAAASEFWDRFCDATESQLMSDVPLGVFLSGGLDSSLIVAAMRARGVDEPRSFSVGFAEAEANELPFARIVAEHYRSEHHEVLCTADDFFDALPRLTWHRDQPLTFSASIPLWYVSRLASKHVKVVLTGEGSDELFAGYGRYPRALWNRRIAGLLDAWMPGALRGGLSALVGSLPNGYVASRAKRSFLARRGTFEDAYLESFADFSRDERAALLVPRVASDAYAAIGQLVDHDLLARNPLEAMLRFDHDTCLEELLHKQDQVSMATSIESRVPFLDHELVEWAAQLPPGVKLNGTVGKALVRRAAEAHLPRSITHARKRGFSVPLGRWLRERGRQVMDAYLPPAGDPYLQRGYVDALLREHEAGIDHTPRLWRVLAFQAWRAQLSSYSAVPDLAAVARYSPPPPRGNRSSVGSMSSRSRTTGRPCRRASTRPNSLHD